MFKSNREDGVRARGREIHLVRANDLVLDAKVKESHHLVISATLKGVQVLNCEYVKLIPL